MNTHTDVSIQVTDLGVSFAHNRVPENIDLHIRPGRIVGLLGPSGAGKTTLMRAIVGLARIDTGSVSVLKQDAGAKSLRQKIGYITQAPEVYSDIGCRQGQCRHHTPSS